MPGLLPGRCFWALAIAEAHELLLAAGPFHIDQISLGWVKATLRHGEPSKSGSIHSGKLREKLRRCIVKVASTKELVRQSNSVFLMCRYAIEFERIGSECPSR
ncbi:hypothetical protein [Methylorubrum thiocyanatum]|uniref:Uncharacterized protein n=1 Tax=Methylorubrum thiocyanatum TaxID=47958 RepID=A0AA40S7U4_9HYPH|nr:hypothetical protein [Methylorubrum thiocyanatum]MBA8916196.1 hypothetical protein [Methylorubrum thiocyanatum]GJE83804.1 hypothetical protein CJNNKLLH_5183 [Methylorubrum thiocyanatum]